LYFAFVAFFTNETYREYVQDDWETFCDRVIILSPEEKVHCRKVRDFYFEKDARINTLDAFPKLTQMLTDRMFLTSCAKAATLHAKFSSVYPYNYNKVGPSLFDVLASIKKKYPVLVKILLGKAQNWFNVNVLGIPHKSNGGKVKHQEKTIIIGMHKLSCTFTTILLISPLILLVHFC